MEFPEVVFFDASDKVDDAAQDLARQLKELGIETPFVVCSRHGQPLATHLHDVETALIETLSGDQGTASELGARAERRQADAVVAIGGGRTLDVAKLAAARAGLRVVAVPTQLSHDGICSPVAVVPNERGEVESLGAIAPVAVFLSLPTLLAAPAPSLHAGIGDLIANPLALRDWRLAAERGLEEIDERAWDLSVRSFEVIEPALDEDVDRRDPAFVRTLAEGLVLSGMGMICCGTSRPASGGEHEISHAIDKLFGGRAMHGAQVALGSVVSMALYDEDVRALQARLRRIGLPQGPRDIGLDEDEFVRAILAAPDTRPGRFTILEDANLDGTAARALVRRIAGD